MSDEEVRVLPEKLSANKVTFKPESWLATVNFVKHLVLENNIMTAILAEQGNGKTTFTHLLHAELIPHVKPYVIAANPLFNRVFFLQQLKDLLCVDGEPSLANFIAHTNEQKSHVLVIIDDAQHLSAVFVEEMLGEIQQLGNTCYFHVCLVSDFSIVPVLNKLAQDVYQDRIHSIELGALTERETKTYLLQHAVPRQNVEKRVTDERVKQFYQLTAGHLVDINRQMRSFFSAKNTSKNNKLFRPINIAASIALIAAAAYIWNPQDSQSLSTALLEQDSASEIEENNILLSQIEPVLYSVVPSYEVAAVRQAILATPLRRNELVAINEEDDVSDESEAVVDKVIVAPKIMPHQEKTVVSAAPVTQIAPVAPKLVKQTVAVKPIVEQARYTIQLLASHNKRELEHFANFHHLKGKVQLRRSQRQGVAWYVLTLGEYKQRQHAKQAVNSLPKDIAQFKPWIRAIADLKVAG